MKYDAEYNSYKFTNEEITNIIHSLIVYSGDPFLDHITKNDVINLLKDMNKSIKTSIDQ